VTDEETAAEATIPANLDTPPEPAPIVATPATDRRQRLLDRLVLGLLTGFMVLTVVLGVSAVALHDLTEILNRRSPVIARIDENEERSRCVDAIQARFSGALGRVVEGAVLDDDELTVAASTDASRFGRLLDQVADGADPCALLERA
jgi:hypothetical protein